jgi:hypothetical protein
MNVDEVTACHAMLVAQWPSLGGDDELGDVRVTAWFHALRPWEPEVARATTERMIQTWSGQFPPRISEWIMAARAEGARMAPRALPDISVKPEERVAPDFLRELLDPVRGLLDEQRSRQRASAGAWRSAIPPHQEGDMLAYDDLYTPTQEDTQ